MAVFSFAYINTANIGNILFRKSIIEIGFIDVMIEFETKRETIITIQQGEVWNMYNHRFSYILLSFLIIILTGCQNSVAVKPTKAAAASIEQRSVQEPIQNKITDYLLARNLNGNVAIVKAGKTIYNSGIGYSNFQTKVLNQQKTTHPVGSITKTIVAVCILQLQDKGLLNIEDPVSKYLPGFPNGEQIKLIHLLNHTSGIQSPVAHARKSSIKAIIEEIENRPVKFPAGTEWNYKDENYVILGYIVEKVTGMGLHQYIQENIFDKAGMKNSGFITKKSPVPYTSTGYVRKNDQQLSLKKINSKVLFGFADIYATAHDICMYDMSLMNGKLVSKKSLEEILTPGSESRYGLGLYNYGYAVHSRGVIGGWESLHVYYQDQTSISILLNVRDKNINIHQVSQDLFKILAEDTPNPRFHKVGIGSFYAHGMLVVR